jgi:hypothetical protein
MSKKQGIALKANKSKKKKVLIEMVINLFLVIIMILVMMINLFLVNL